MADFKSDVKRPLERHILIIQVMMLRRDGRTSFRRGEGIGSLPQEALDELLMIFATSSSVAEVKCSRVDGGQADTISASRSKDRPLVEDCRISKEPRILSIFDTKKVLNCSA